MGRLNGSLRITIYSAIRKLSIALESSSDLGRYPPRVFDGSPCVFHPVDEVGGGIGARRDRRGKAWSRS